MSESSHGDANTTQPREKINAEKIFVPKPFIYKEDGWLNPKGIFWGCESNEHEQCAKYVSDHSIDKSDDLSGIEKTPRQILDKHRFAQLNAGIVLPVSGVALTEQQRTKIDEAIKKGIELKLALSTVKPTRQEFEGMTTAYNLGLLDVQQQDLVRRFFDGDDFFRVDDNGKIAKTLFDTLTLGFEDGPSYSYQQGYKRTHKYKVPKDKSFAVELDEHIHDGDSGLYSTHWVRVVDKGEFEKIEEKYAQEQEDLKLRHASRNQSISLSEPTKLIPRRIKGVKQKEFRHIDLE